MGFGGQSPVAKVAREAGTCNDLHGAGFQIKLEHLVVARVSKVEDAVRVEGEAGGAADWIYLSLRPDRGDLGGGCVDTANPMVAGVGEIDIALGINGQAGGVVDCGFGSRSAIT